MTTRNHLGLAHFRVPTEGVLDYTYFNADGVGVVILAREGVAADWGAYIGAICLPWATEEQAIAYVAAHGTKLNKAMATRWFPHLPAEAYRP